MPLLVVAVAGCAKGPERTVENFYTAIEKGEIDEAQGYLSSSLVQMLPPAKITAGLTKQHEEIVRCGGIKNIEVDLEGEGDVRSGTATVTYRGDCSVDSEGVKLAREEGEWRLQADK
jgi:ketosteroid isomerase-like protein